LRSCYHVYTHAEGETLHALRIEPGRRGRTLCGEWCRRFPIAYASARAVERIEEHIDCERCLAILEEENHGW